MAKKHTSLRHGLNTLNLLLVATFIVLALYSAVGQQTLPYIGKYRVDVERYISQQLNSRLHIRELSGDMRILTPSLHVEGITLYPQGSQAERPMLSIAAMDFVLDPGSSLLNLTPVFKSVRLSGVSIILDKDASIAQPATPQHTMSSVQRFVEGLLLQQHLEINNVSVETWLNDERKTLQIDHLVMSGDGFNRLMTGSISYGDAHQIKAGMRIFSRGSPYDLEDFYARGVIDLPNLDINYWLQQLSGAAIFDELQASAQLGFEFKQGVLNYAKLNMATPKLSIAGHGDFKNINTQLWLRQNDIDSWTLWLDDGKFTFQDKKWQLQDLGLQLAKTPQGNRWQGFAKKVNLQYTQDLLSELSLMPPSLRSWLDGLQARGEVNNLSLILQQNPGEELDFTLAGELQDISIDAHAGIPGIKNLSGVLAASNNSGRIQFSSEKMELDFPQIYDEPFKVTRGRGQVDWFMDEQQVRVVGDGLQLSLADVDAIQGGFQLWLPKLETLDGALALNLSLTGAQLSAQPKLVPKAVSVGLKDWLNSALKRGRVAEGNLYLYSALSEEQPLPQLELYLKLDDVDLSYLPQWPEVRQAQGELFIDSRRVLATISSAQTLGGTLHDSQIAFQHDERGLGFLWIDSLAVGAAPELLSYFQQTPLQAIVNHQLDDWQLAGTHETSLGFKIPLDSPLEDMAVAVQTRLDDAELAMNDVGLNFLQLNGPLQFTSRQGLSSAGLQTRLWDEHIDVTIGSQFKGGDLRTDIAFKGDLNTQGLKDWLRLGLLNGVSGKTPVAGHFIIDSRDGGFTGLKVASQLQGIALDLPAPLFKPSQQAVAFNSSVQIKDGLTLKLSYADKVNLAMQFDAGVLSAGQVYLGAVEAYVPNAPGLVVKGHVETLNVDDWLEAWQGILKMNQRYAPAASNARETTNPLSSISLSSAEIVYGERVFERVKTDINVAGEQWHIKLDAPLAKGDLVYEAGEATVVKLEYLHWPALSADKPDSETDPLLEVDPAAFPALDVNIAEIFLGPTNYGRWKLRVVPTVDGVVIDDIDGQIKKLNVAGSMSWMKPSTGLTTEKTALNLQLSSTDVGGVQTAWHQKPALEAEYLQTHLDVHWLASPTQFELANLSGVVDFHLKDGRFIEAGDTGALGAFGLLNFGAVGRRLRLDFSDVYQTGLHFDDIKGKTHISHGLLEIEDTLDFVGPSASFSASGSVNVLSKELDQELAVTFPVFSTLPFVAILAGFAPPIAASIYVGEKLVGGEIEKFSSATYKLSGTWEEPELKIMKRFDNEIEGKKYKSYWLRMKDVFGLGEDD
ncbi:MAG: YhdP family protein [Bermanella sp.]